MLQMENTLFAAAEKAVYYTTHH